MTTMPVPRVPSGVPTGGQFAPTGHAEADLALAPTAPASVVATDTTFTARYETVDAKIEAYRGELDAAVASLSTDANYLAYMDTMARFHHYSPANQLLIMIQTGGQATRVAGFNKWKEMGRTVKKGEKAIGIFAPRTVTVKGADGKPLKDDNGRTQKRFIGFTTASVFDVSQTEGDPLPELDNRLSIDPPAGYIEDLTAAIEAEGFTVRYADDLCGANGRTSPDTKTVAIKASLNPAHRAKTLAHELGHIHAGHLDRMDEYHTGAGGCRGEMELEAESFAYVVCRANGMTTEVSKYSSTYIASWVGTDPSDVKASTERVSKAVKTALGSGRFRNVTD